MPRSPNLPLEIWHLICDSYPRPWTFENSASPIKYGDTYLHVNHRKEGLLALSLVSKGISQVAQQHLFRWVEVGDQAGDVLCFVRAIIDNPRLASYVQGLVLEQWISFDDERESVKQELIDAHGQIAARLGFDPGDGASTSMAEDGESESVPEIYQLLIPLAPNLDNLQLCTRTQSEPFGLLGRLHNEGVISPLPLVNTLTLRHDDTEMGFALLDYATILSLVPNVTQMRLTQACSVNSEPEDEIDQLSQCFPSGVKHLDMELCNFEEPDFAVLMQCCKGLETFLYVSGGALTSDSNDEISLKGVVTHLRLCKESLRSVTIDMQSSMEADRDADVELDDFGDFPLLTQLVIDGKVLRGMPLNNEFVF